jgi:cellulose synthase/poly-beta-1,6-N-acetylglucosamine synthase-like glycosyltransferase
MYFLFGIYALALTFIAVYCSSQVILWLDYRKGKKGKEGFVNGKKSKAKLSADLPFVTIQLPIFNELYVVERLIDNMVKMNYPKDKFQIHILDDSTDETVEVTRKKVSEYQALGFDIQQVTRTNRQGYKAGALKEATHLAKGDLIAIFDADFMPRPDFLLETIPYFEDKKIGVVQTRWEHINKEYSLLTKLQAMQLDVHFSVEQQGRFAGNSLLQFNGTAGVWRKQTIDDAGGWEADTLTEDLDLSYRAQVNGWQIIYLESVGSPAELPVEMNGLKSQQFRWMKGGAENARKNLVRIWSSNIPLKKKINGTTHLLNSTVFLAVLTAGLTSVPLVFLLDGVNFPMAQYFLGLFVISTLAILLIYYEANVRAFFQEGSYSHRLGIFILYFPIFLALSMGLSFHNTVAVLEGWSGKKSAFIRTPKFNIQTFGDSFEGTKYVAQKITWTTIFEALLTLYFLFGFIAGIVVGNPAFLVFHGLLVIGFGTITFYTILHLNKGN